MIENHKKLPPNYAEVKEDALVGSWNRYLALAKKVTGTDKVNSCTNTDRTVGALISWGNVSKTPKYHDHNLVFTVTQGRAYYFTGDMQGGFGVPMVRDVQDKDNTLIIEGYQDNISRTLALDKEGLKYFCYQVNDEQNVKTITCSRDNNGYQTALDVLSIDKPQTTPFLHIEIPNAITAEVNDTYLRLVTKMDIIDMAFFLDHTGIREIRTDKPDRKTNKPSFAYLRDTGTFKYHKPGEPLAEWNDVLAVLFHENQLYVGIGTQPGEGQVVFDKEGVRSVEFEKKLRNDNESFIFSKEDAQIIYQADSHTEIIELNDAKVKRITAEGIYFDCTFNGQPIKVDFSTDGSMRFGIPYKGKKGEIRFSYVNKPSAISLGEHSQVETITLAKYSDVYIGDQLEIVFAECTRQELEHEQEEIQRDNLQSALRIDLEKEFKKRGI